MGELPMSTDSYQHTQVWKRTLAPQKKDDHSASRERLRTAFVRFRERAAQLGGDISRDLPFFTVHDVTHLDALWEMVDLIAGSDYPLTPSETFILGGAILVHDLAMSQAAYQNEFDKLKSEPIWRDTVSGLLRGKFSRTPTRDEIANPDAETEKSAIQTLLRELHARQATVLPTKEWGYAGTKYYLLEDAELRVAFADDIGKVAFSHNWPLEHLLNSTKLLQKPAGGPGWLPRQWTVDLVKLACLLRTADALHADERRAPGFLAALRQPSGISDQHWRFQLLLNAPHREQKDDRIRYRSNRPFKIDEFDAWWICHDWLRIVDRELWTVDALLADTGRPRLAAKGVWNVDDPTRLAEDVQTEGWEPANAEVRISDIAGLVRMLGGKQLYGDRPEVPLRELIQNAADAVRARRKIQSRDTAFGQIIVRSGMDDTNNQEWIEVQDNGIGMSKYVLTGPLLDFGVAFWGTSRMRREFPGLEAAGMEATGQFGIGFFSTFMWGEHVRVITRRYDRGYDETWVLEFRSGVHIRPLLRKGTSEEQCSLPEGGTRVRVWCEASRQIPMTLLRRESPSTSPCNWVELCEWLAPALDVNLDVDVEGTLHSAVKADDWLTIDATTMIWRLNRKSSDNARSAIQRKCTFWHYATSFLSMVWDENGRPFGRGTIWGHGPSWYRASCTVCGGIRTDGGANFMGILFAKPETASRHSPIKSQDQTEWRDWAQEQRTLDRTVKFDIELRAQAAIQLTPFLNPEDMPIGKNQNGWITLNEFASEIKDVSIFYCIAGSLWAVSSLLQKFQNKPTIVVDGHYVMNQLDGGGFAVVRLLQKEAEKQWGCECQVSDLNQGMTSIAIDGEPASMHVITFTRSDSDAPQA